MENTVLRQSLDLVQARTNVAKMPRAKKTQAMCKACLFGVGAVVLAGLWLARFNSAMQAQIRYEKVQGVTENIVIYDVGCYIGPYSDHEKAEELASHSRDCLMDKDCRDKGSSWSYVFIANGALMVCLAFDMICIGFGAFKPTIKVIGAGFASCLCFAHLAILIATAVYRF